jgi:outer membrane protein OmpA-like peptidoglycan-associated protein
MNALKGSLAAVIVLGLVSPSRAIDFKNRLSVGGSYGVTDPRWPGGFHDAYDGDKGFSGYIGYGLIDNLSLVASYSDLMVERHTNDLRTRFRPVVLSLRFNLAPKWILNPYVIAGGGVSMNERENAAGPNDRWTKIVGRGGVGAEIFVTQSTSFGAEALYHQIVAENGARDYGLVTYAGTVNIYFGEGQKTKEAREAAEAAKREAESARAAAAAAAQQSATAQAQTQTAQQQTLEAQNAAAAAAAAKAEAERKASEMQNQAKTAQAELDKIKDMIARKEMKPVQFKTGSSDLLPESNAALDMIATTMKKYPDLKLRVEGHTDSQGSDALNQKLSQSRAESVKTYLTGQGLPDAQVNAVGFGETQPIASNDTSEGRAKNRRVEFMIFL